MGKFLKNIKRAGQNRCAGGNFFLKINKHSDPKKTVQGGIFSQKYSQNTTEPLLMETIKKFPQPIQKSIQSITKPLPKHYQTTPKEGRIAWKDVCLIRTGPMPINMQDGMNK